MNRLAFADITNEARSTKDEKNAKKNILFKKTFSSKKPPVYPTTRLPLNRKLSSSSLLEKEEINEFSTYNSIILDDSSQCHNDDEVNITPTSQGDIYGMSSWDTTESMKEEEGDVPILDDEKGFSSTDDIYSNIQYQAEKENDDNNNDGNSSFSMVTADVSWLADVTSSKSEEMTQVNRRNKLHDLKARHKRLQDASYQKIEYIRHSLNFSSSYHADDELTTVATFTSSFGNSVNDNSPTANSYRVKVPPTSMFRMMKPPNEVVLMHNNNGDIATKQSLQTENTRLNSELTLMKKVLRKRRNLSVVKGVVFAGSIIIIFAFLFWVPLQQHADESLQLSFFDSTKMLLSHSSSPLISTIDDKLLIAAPKNTESDNSFLQIEEICNTKNNGVLILEIVEKLNLSSKIMEHHSYEKILSEIDNKLDLLSQKEHEGNSYDNTLKHAIDFYASNENNINDVIGAWFE